GTRSLGNTCCALQQNRRRRCLRNKGETTVVVNRYHHRDNQAVQFFRAGARIELFAELHDIDLRLSECWAYRRRRRSLARSDLQLNLSDYLLCHETSSEL